MLLAKSTGQRPNLWHC